MPTDKLPREEIKELADYMERWALRLWWMPFKTSEKFLRVVIWLKKFQYNVCGQGYICRGGDRCTSDHK